MQSITKFTNNFHGESVTYKSIDSVMTEEEILNYQIELLNFLDLMSLKIGAPIVILRIINPSILRNGTRHAVKKLMSNVIEVVILNDQSNGEDVLISRIPIIPNDLDMPSDFKRLKFTFRNAFSMAINKARGQVCGFNLEYPCSTHGQL